MPISYKVCLTDVQTGEEKIFKSTVKASEYLKRSKMYIKVRLGRANKVAYGIDGKEYKITVLSVEKVTSKPKKPKDPANAKYAGYKPATLCYECARSVSFCPWSKRGEAVEGWNAVPTKLKNGQSRNGSGQVVPESVVDSYHVIDCPLFIQEGKTVEERRAQRKMLIEEAKNGKEN